jgi:hypothetical protein
MWKCRKHLNLNYCQTHYSYLCLVVQCTSPKFIIFNVVCASAAAWVSTSNAGFALTACVLLLEPGSGES